MRELTLALLDPRPALNSLPSTLQPSPPDARRDNSDPGECECLFLGHPITSINLQDALGPEPAPGYALESERTVGLQGFPGR